MSKKNPENKTVLENPQDQAKNVLKLGTGYGFDAPVLTDDFEVKTSGAEIIEEPEEKFEKAPSVSIHDEPSSHYQDGAKYRQIAIDLKEMIMPLLYNLRDSADTGDTIHWPNRKKEIGAQIRKIQKLTKELNEKE